ncbi:MAG: serine/threonine-protein kinase [bacterium]
MDEVVICRVCGQGWTGAAPGDRCPTGDGGVLVAQKVHEKFFSDTFIGRAVAGKYVIIGKLGEGGFGSVYRAIQEPVGRTVAVKVIASGEANDEELRGRFFREARVVSKLSNRATVTLHDYGEDDDGTLFMVFEFIAGKLLADLIAHGPMAPARVVGLVQQVLGACAEAHELGLVHRDLKPGNIMVSEGALGTEEVKVLDFGIAKVQNPDGMDDVRTREGVVLGTPRYMSPEQSQDARLDGRSDLYAMGVILYEMLVGQPPFGGDVPFDILIAHIQSPVPPMPAALQVPPALEAVAMRALAKKPADRYATAEEMSRALSEAIGQGSTSGAVRPVVVERPPSGRVEAVIPTGEMLVPRSKAPLIIAVVVALAVVGAAVWFFARKPSTPGAADAGAKVIAVEIGGEEPATALAPVVRLVQAGRLDDAALSLRRTLEIAGDRKALIAYARTLPELEKVLADPGLADLLK